MNRLPLLLATLSVAVACTKPDAASTGAPLAAADAGPSSRPKSGPASAVVERDDFADGVVKVGQAFGLEQEVQLADIYGEPGKFEGKAVRVKGTVKETCTAMGCWITLAAADGNHPVRVTFKDHAFFVPKDSNGAAALIEGEIKIKNLDKDTVKHFEDEGATVQGKKPDGTATEIALEAYAVELRRS